MRVCFIAISLVLRDFSDTATEEPAAPGGWGGSASHAINVCALRVSAPPEGFPRKSTSRLGSGHPSRPLGVCPERSLSNQIESDQTQQIATTITSQELWHSFVLSARPHFISYKYPRFKGLVTARHINLRRDGKRRHIERTEVATLTKDGRAWLRKSGEVPKGRWDLVPVEEARALGSSETKRCPECHGKVRAMRAGGHTPGCPQVPWARSV
jgi:hypothetical protein